MQWCQSLNAPLPEFWFPSGWNLYAEDIYEDDDTLINSSQKPDSDLKLKINQRAKIACQVIAENLWKEHPEMTIADMIKQDAIRNLGGSESYTDAVVRKWLSGVAPTAVKERRGRPKKNKK